VSAQVDGNGASGPLRSRACSSVDAQLGGVESVLRVIPRLNVVAGIGEHVVDRSF
jgi:hypothetical protein